jgi:hypothetical protein
MWQIQGRWELHTGFLGGGRRPEGKKHLGVDGRIILKCISKKWDGGTNSIDLAHDRDRWRDIVNVVMNLWVL